MRHVIATCPATDPNRPAFLHIAIPGHPDDLAAPREWTPLPCWVPDSGCTTPHPFLEHDPTVVAGFLRAVALEAEEPSRRSGPLVPVQADSDAHNAHQTAASADGARMSSGARMSTGAVR